MNAKVTTETINETARRAKEAAPEFARQARNRSRKKADGDIHQVKRAVGQSRVQEAAAATEVKMPPEETMA